MFFSRTSKLNRYIMSDEDSNTGSWITISEHYVKRGDIIENKLLSLKDVCLKCIVDNFPVFNSAFTETQDGVLRHNLLFLQRVFTDRLLRDMVMKVDGIPEEYLDFFVNGHLKVVQLDVFRNCDSSKLLTLLEKFGHGFQSLTLNRLHRHSKDLLRVLSSTPNIEVLEASDIIDVEIIRKLPSLCTKLKTIIGFQNLADEIIIYLLKNLPTLERLPSIDNLPNILYKAHKDDFVNNTLSNVPKYKLQELSIEEINFLSPRNDEWLTNALSVCVELCPLIRKINICVDAQDQLQLVIKFPELEDVTLKSMYPSVHDELVWDDLLKIRGNKLKHLNLGAGKLSAFTLMQSCSNLETLKLMSVKVESFSTSGAMFSNLKRIHIDDYNFENEPDGAKLLVTILSNSKILSEINLKGCNLDETTLKAELVKTLTKGTIKFLSFVSSRGIDLEFVKSILTSADTLKSLDLSSCSPISIGECKTLKSFNDKVIIVFTDPEFDAEYDSEFSGDSYDYDFYSHDDFFDNYDDYDEYSDGEFYDTDGDY